jgi:hypothetical protein
VKKQDWSVLEHGVSPMSIRALFGRLGNDGASADRVLSNEVRVSRDRMLSHDGRGKNGEMTSVRDSEQEGQIVIALSANQCNAYF